MREALSLFRLIPFLGAKEAEPACEFLPSLQSQILRTESPCLLLSCPAGIQMKLNNGVVFLTSVVLHNGEMWGTNSKQRAVLVCLHKKRFLRAKCSSVLMRQWDRTSHPCMRADCLGQACCRNRSLIWETDECQEESDQKEVLTAHNRTGNRTARW